MQRWMGLARLIGIGWYIGICIVLGIGGGIWLDHKAGTTIIFTLLGIGVGLLLAAWGVYRMLLPTLKDRNKED